MSSGINCAVITASSSKSSRLRAYVYPSTHNHQRLNPYIPNLKKALGRWFDVLENNEKVYRLPYSAQLLWRSCQLKTDVYFLNWVESISHLRHGKLQFWITMLALWVMKMRRRIIVYTYHNLHPHGGIDYNTQSIERWLMKYAHVIVTHSRVAEKEVRKHAKGQVIYVCHPVNVFSDIKPYNVISQPDLFIWGSILPYKGVLEFLQCKEFQMSGLKLKIIGQCKDLQLCNKIEECCKASGSLAVYENRSPSFDEIAAYCRTAHYVLFPYVGDSISSSGALLDTISLGGLPLGPRKGAFLDLAEEGVCLTYDNYAELILIAKAKKAKNNTVDFCQRNTWDKFAKVLSETVMKATNS